MTPILKGTCYVLHQGIYDEILEYKNRMILYPEHSLPLMELVSGRRWETSVITENPWIIACYPQEECQKRGYNATFVDALQAKFEEKNGWYYRITKI